MYSNGHLGSVRFPFGLDGRLLLGAGVDPTSGNRRAIGVVDPRVVRHGIHERKASVASGLLYDTPIEGLAQAVCGDEPKTLGLTRAHHLPGAVPPMHHEIRAFWDLWPDTPQGLHVAVTQRTSHGTRADKWRVAHNEIRSWPFSLARVDVAPLLDLGCFVRHQLASHRVALGGDAIPPGQRVTTGIAHDLGTVVGQHGIAMFDVAVVRRY